MVHGSSFDDYFDYFGKAALRHFRPKQTFNVTFNFVANFEGNKGKQKNLHWK